MKIHFSHRSILILLSLAGFLIYSPVLSAPFFYDDYELLITSPLVRHIPTLFAQWQSAGLKFLTYFTFALNFRVGLDNPWGFHLVNIVIHLFNVWLLYSLAGHILRAQKIKSLFTDQQKSMTALISAAIFMIHPVATSAVNYIWQRAELLTAMFYLSALIFYVIARQDKKKLFFVMAATCFVIGMFAKGTIISLPLMLIPIEYALWPLSPRRRRNIFVATGLVFFGLCLFLWQPWKVRVAGESLPFIVLTGTSLTFEHVWTQLFVFVKYFGLAIFPVHQNFDYDVPLAVSFWEGRIVLSALLLAGLLWIADVFWNKYRLLCVGIFWFLLALLPAALMGGREPMWEYRMYFSLAGLIFGLVATAFQVFEFKKVLIGSLLIGMIFSCLAFSRNLLWRSPELLLLDNIKKSPNKYMPVHLLGTYYLQQGRVEDARLYLEKTIALAPNNAESYNNLALIAKNNGEIQKAQDYFQRAIVLRPTLTSAYVNLAYLLLDQGQDIKAEEMLRQGLTFSQTEGLYVGLAKVNLSRGHFDEVEKYLEKSLTINPRAVPAYFCYGELFVARQEKQKAREMFHKVLELNPSLINLVPLEYR